jgi:hypothetical protein
MAGYTRQEVYADTDVIEATDTNNEFDQLVAAFNSSTGHKHDGTAAEGPLIGLISDATQTDKVEVVTGGAKTTGTHQVTGILTADVDIVLTAGNVTLAALATVDGRDVSVDGTKLDGIEAAATADQTGAEIKTAYQAEANAFTDAQFTKLAGIETAATADQSATEVVFTPTGNVAATNVQTAIAEVDTEKAALAGATFTGAVTVPGFTSTGIDDNATGERVQIGDAGIVYGAAGAQYIFQHIVNDQLAIFSGGSGTTQGANILLFGGTHATTANDIRLRGGATNQLVYDDSASLWDFQANDISTTGTLTCGAFTSTGIDDNTTGERLQLSDTELTLGVSGAGFVQKSASDTNSLTVSGGTSSNVGANIILFGSTHATLANDLNFRSGGTTQLGYDDSASLWDFQANAITTSGVITGDGSGLTNLNSASTTAEGVVERATQAEVDAGTDAVRYVTPDTLTNFSGLGVFSSAFTSAEQTLTSAGSLTLAHSLGAEPTLIQVRLINKTAELGYSIGDEVIVNPHQNVGGASVNHGLSVVPDSTNLNVRYGSNSQIFVLIHKTTGVSTFITNVNWKMIILAWI